MIEYPKQKKKLYLHGWDDLRAQTVVVMDAEQEAVARKGWIQDVERQLAAV